MLKVKNADVTPKAPKGKAPAKVDPFTAVPEEETRQLEISLTNSSKGDLKGLKVVAVYFSKTPGNPEIGVEKNEELTADLAQSAAVELKAQPVTFKFTPSVRDRKGKRTKPVGTKSAGYGVQVLHEDKVLASKFEPRGLEQVLNK